MQLKALAFGYSKGKKNNSKRASNNEQNKRNKGKGTQQHQGSSEALDERWKKIDEEVSFCIG